MAKRNYHLERSRTFTCVLYEDDKEHMKILDNIVSNYDFAFIRHDMDRWEEDIEEEEVGIVHHKGDLKKPHYHVVIDFPNARSLSKLKQFLGLDYLMTANFFFICRYLIHLDDPHKFQYDRCLIESNILSRVFNCLDKEYNSSEQDSHLLYKYIVDRNFITFRELSQYAFENGLFSELKRNVYFYKQFTDDYGFRNLKFN